MKSISTSKKWLLPMLAIFTLMACQKNIRETKDPGAKLRQTREKANLISVTGSYHFIKPLK